MARKGGRSKAAQLEDELNQVVALRDCSDRSVVVEKLGNALRSKQTLLVARAARLAGELGVSEVETDMLAAFERLMKDPARLDKGCRGTTGIAEALLELELDRPEVFRRGFRHVQMEVVSFGPPEDVAAELRARSALGLARCGGTETVTELVAGLVDSEEMVRIATARAIGGSGRVDAEAVLRLKVLVGDEEPEVLVECLSALLYLSAERSLPLVEPFLAAKESWLRQAAILALGESRSEMAVARLIAFWPDELDREVRETVLIALATSRRETAHTFLFDLVSDGHVGDAALAVAAFDGLLTDTRLRDRLETAIEQSRHRETLLESLDRR